jgi:hypothetical protein
MPTSLQIAVLVRSHQRGDRQRSDQMEPIQLQ